MKQFEIKSSKTDNVAIIMAPETLVDEATKQQVRDLVNHEVLQKATIRMMPDLHAGKGCTIGTTLRFESFSDMKINPEWVGNDIGCSVSVYHLGSVEEVNMDFDKLDELAKTLHEPDSEKWEGSELFVRLMGQDIVKKAEEEIGRISGGNHMAEVGVMDGHYYLTIHNGSLFLGQHVFNKWMKKLKKQQQVDVKPIIRELKRQGKQQYIEDIIKTIKQTQSKIFEEQRYLSGEDLREYIREVGICTYYAYSNHDVVFRRFKRALGLGKEVSSVPKYRTTHNYIDGFSPFLFVATDKPLTVFKGATPAHKDAPVAIPINMRDGVIVGRGKGNPDWNYAAPHGAGRVMSRTEAKKNIRLDTYFEQTKEVKSISINEDTLDEAPDAYKPMDYILEQIKDTVDVEGIIKPIYNFKVAEGEPHWRKQKREVKV